MHNGSVILSCNHAKPHHHCADRACHPMLLLCEPKGYQCVECYILALDANAHYDSRNNRHCELLQYCAYGEKYLSGHYQSQEQ